MGLRRRREGRERPEDTGAKSNPRALDKRNCRMRRREGGGKEGEARGREGGVKPNLNTALLLLWQLTMGRFMMVRAMGAKETQRSEVRRAPS